MDPFLLKHHPWRLMTSHRLINQLSPVRIRQSLQLCKRRRKRSWRERRKKRPKLKHQDFKLLKLSSLPKHQLIPHKSLLQSQRQHQFKQLLLSQLKKPQNKFQLMLSKIHWQVPLMVFQASNLQTVPTPPVLSINPVELQLKMLERLALKIQTSSPLSKIL